MMDGLMKKSLYLPIALLVAVPVVALAVTVANKAPPPDPASNTSADAAAGATWVPERELSCILGRSTNLDPTKNQRLDEIISEGRHSFSIRLPGKSIVATAEPDPTDAPEPVDARTAILSDPDGLASGVPARFDRVVDLWPKRVEMITNIDPPLANLIIISAIDPKTSTAHLFMTKARDAASLDLQHVYQGDCTVKTRG
jgi:hypothetical protein